MGSKSSETLLRQESLALASMARDDPPVRSTASSTAPASSTVAAMRFFMKLFRTNNIDVVQCCQYHFGFDLPSTIWLKRVQKFEAKFKECDNLFCKLTVCK